MLRLSKTNKGFSSPPFIFLLVDITIKYNHLLNTYEFINRLSYYWKGGEKKIFKKQVLSIF